MPVSPMARSGRPEETASMAERKQAMDILVLATGFGFFALMFGYIILCEKL